MKKGVVMADLTQFDLSRAYWDFAFANPELVKATHAAIFFFAMEHRNRLGWKEKFGMPTSMALDAIGYKDYEGYKRCFNDLVSWGFFILIQASKNQYSSCIISLADGKGKDKKSLSAAVKKHGSRLSEKSVSTPESTPESTPSIDKPITYNLEPITVQPQLPQKIDEVAVNVYQNLEAFKQSFLKDGFSVSIISQRGISPESVAGWLDAFNRRLIFTADTLKQEREYRSHFANWLVKVPDYQTADPATYDPIKDPEIKKQTPQQQMQYKTAQQILEERYKK